jgi:hypothetical protein
MAKKKTPPRKKKEAPKPSTALAIIPKVTKGPPPKEEPEFERAASGFDPVYEAEKAGTAKEYVELLRKLMDAKAATDTEFFRRLFKQQRNRLVDIGSELLEVDKATDIHRLQAEAKYIKRLLEQYRQTVDDVNNYIASSPLFSGQMTIRAEWNSALGKIEIKKL